jgi:hypothetical protein
MSINFCFPIEKSPFTGTPKPFTGNKPFTGTTKPATGTKNGNAINLNGKHKIRYVNTITPYGNHKTFYENSA